MAMYRHIREFQARESELVNPDEVPLSEGVFISDNRGSLELWFPPSLEPDGTPLPRTAAFLLAMFVRFHEDPAFVDTVIAQFERTPVQTRN
jgi:hypothetical protein